jgi:Asp/Glu/hydantoin racemase
MKIQVINPNTSLAMTESIGVAARSVARAGTEIVAVCPTFGPASIESYSRRGKRFRGCLRSSDGSIENTNVM